MHKYRFTIKIRVKLENKCNKKKIEKEYKDRKKDLSEKCKTSEIKREIKNIKDTRRLTPYLGRNKGSM
jgi:hypothetical protein